MYSDNQSAIALCCNIVKPFQIQAYRHRIYFIKGAVENGAINFTFVYTDSVFKLAVIFTKIALDDALVAPVNRLKIGKCNLRLSSDLTSKEATLQVVYDVLKLTPFYKAFQASADVLEIYMQEFWAIDPLVQWRDKDDYSSMSTSYINPGDHLLRLSTSVSVCDDDDDDDDDDEDDDANKDSDAHDDDDDDDNDATDRYGGIDNIIYPNENQKDDDRVKDGEEDKEGDVTNVNLEGGDVDMTDIDTTKDTEDAHVTLMAATLVVQQQSSSVSDLVSKFISPTTDDESDLSKLKQSNPFTEAISSILGIVNEYLGSKMKEAADVAIQLKSNSPGEEVKHEENQEFLNSLDSNIIYGIASSLSELELKWILMDKMEDNKLINRSDVQKNLYNALVEAYNTNKDLLSSYGTQSSFDEFMATPIDFSAFMINRLKIDHLTQELLTGPTYDLIKGMPYPHNLSKPLSLIPNARGRLIIPFDHFINNDLEYLKGGSSSRKYTTSITKTKAADYGQVKWIEDRIPRTTWSVVPIDYDKHEYWGKLTNLKLDDKYALNVALRMYTRRIAIQERMEDLQLAVKSYQKKINLTRPDTTRPDLRKMTLYTGYPDVQGIIYQDELSKNRLIRTDELHKFSDGTLNHVCINLNDIATGIQMDYLSKRRWSPQDKRRARVMISSIDRKLRDQSYKAVRLRYSNPMIQPEPEGSTQGYLPVSIEVLRFYTLAGNLVKEILLKLNLPDHRILKDGGEGNRATYGTEWHGLEDGKTCMTRSSTKELFTPFKNPEREFHSSRKLFKTPSLDELSLPKFDLFSDLEEHFEEYVAGKMTETMEEYMCKTRDKVEYNGRNVLGTFVNAPIFVGNFSVVTDFTVVENMDAYRDEGMGEVIVGEPFCKALYVETRRFDGIITIFNGNDSVTYQMVRSHPIFKHLTDKQCNKIPPLLKVSEHDKMNGISHSYQKLKGFYKGILDLGPEFIQDEKNVERLTRGHISVHEME
ncbi:hypothetical protein Tco_1410676 [Tanacetum coccineum]